jgi:hypothetical protein
MLLERAQVSVAEATRRLVGLQAQLPRPPYIGLWTRLARFQRDDLSNHIDKRTLVRAPLLRATLHLSTAKEYLEFRNVLQPVLSRALSGLPAERTKGFDIDALVADARQCLEDGPRTFTALREVLAKHHPKLDVRAMGYAVRTHLPLVQVPGKGGWGFPNDPEFALAEAWLGQPPAASSDPRQLVLRYLAAFGPATARDMQTWSGLQGLRDTLETLRPELRVFAAEDGRELFDLPEAPLPSSDVPAPPRFLPEFDNLVLGHADRSRVVPEAYRPKIFLSALRVRATFLVDGFVHGAWSVERKKKEAALVLAPFAPLAKAEREALMEEGERLVRFVEEEAGTWDVRFAKG